MGVVLAEGERKTGLRVVVAVTAVVGQVLDGKTGQPEAGARVSLIGRGSDLMFDQQLTDDTGRFRIEGVTLGPALVLARAFRRSGRTRVVVPADGTLDVGVIELQPIPEE